MRLSSFQIRNFKSIIDTGECHLSDSDNILVLAGQNEAGKSAVIEALNFFGNGPAADFEKLHRRQDEHPEVVCQFLLEKPDIDAVYDATQNQDLKKYFADNPRVSFVRGSTTTDQFDEIYFTDEQQKALNKFFSNSGQEGTEEAQTAEGASSTTSSVSIISVKTLDELEQFLFNRNRSIVFFDAFSDLLPGEVAVSEINKYPAVLDFQKIFKINFAEVVKRDTRAIGREEQRLNREASDNLNTYWTQKIEEGGKYNFTVKIVPKVPVESASMIEFKIDRDDVDPLFMEQKSKGFRWFSAFNLRLRALGVEEDEIKNLVVLIDEPGQGLHEKAQRDVKTVMEELGQKGAQVVYTTHHPNLIGTEGMEFARIRVVSNTKANGTKVETVAQFSSRADIGATDTLAPLITAMGIHSIHSLVNPDRKNVVVEGITDHYYLCAFRKLFTKSDQFYFLPACGVNNVPNLVSVLLGWGFNFKAVFDQDPRAGRKAYNLLKKEFYENDDTLTHEHVFKLPNCTGIEDLFTSEDFHQFVLKQPLPTGTVPPNSELAVGRKEVLARLFLEAVETGAPIQLSGQTQQNVSAIFDWLDQKFGL